MSKLTRLISILAICCLFLTWPQPVSAQSQLSDFRTATVAEVIKEKTVDLGGELGYIQQLRLVERNGESHVVTNGSEFQPLTRTQRISAGTKVVVSSQLTEDGQMGLVINDVYRLPVLVALGIFFAILIIVVASWRGFFSILGMLLSLVILSVYIIPEILSGSNPLTTVLLGASGTAIFTMYLAHGWKKKTHIALFSMILCLIFVALLSNFAAILGQFVGLGSEEAAFLRFGATAQLNLRGLYLAGVLLGTLGILDDITLSQSAVVNQLSSANPKLGFSQLYDRALDVGRDHVASLVNTLIFAYAAGSLPLFLLFSLYRSEPVWVIFNSELLAEEILRTLAGSIGLVLAVPLTTAIASYFAVTKQPFKELLHFRQRFKRSS